LLNRVSDSSYFVCRETISFVRAASENYNIAQRIAVETDGLVIAQMTLLNM